VANWQVKSSRVCLVAGQNGFWSKSGHFKWVRNRSVNKVTDQVELTCISHEIKFFFFKKERKKERKKKKKKKKKCICHLESHATNYLI